jgi:type II secretory pathway component PulC
MFSSALAWWRGSAAIARSGAAVSVALAICIAADLCRIALSLKEPAAPAATVRTAGPRSRIDPALIIAAHLFGAAPRPQSQDSPGAAAERLVLTGVIASADSREGFAIIGGGAGGSRLYHTGAQTAPGTTLSEVFADHVVLERDGERIVLALPRQLAGGRADYPVRRRVALASRGSGAAGERVPASPEDFKPPPLSDASAITSGIGGRAMKVDGELGIPVRLNARNGEALKVLGLQPNDIIMAVNGRSISEHGSLMAALEQGDTALTIVRDGGRTSIVIDSATASAAANLIRAATPN